MPVVLLQYSLYAYITIRMSMFGASHEIDDDDDNDDDNEGDD